MPRRVARSLRQVLARCAGVEGPVPWIDAAVAVRAEDLGLAAVVDAALRDGLARASLPPDRRAELAEAANHEAALVMAAEGEALSVARRLHTAGIDVVAMKGLVSNALVHRPHRWCRAPGDVDLLVPADAADEAVRIFLDDAAYEPHGGLDPDFYRDHHHLQPFARVGRHACPVELHRRVSGTTTGNVVIDHDGLWDRVVDFPELGPHIKRLDDVDHCLATIIHIDRDDAYLDRGRQLFDLALLLERCAGREAELAERAAEWNASSTLERALWALDAFLERPVRARRASGPLQSLWVRFAVDQSIRGGTESALPAWYRQGVFRAITHGRGARRIVAAFIDPLRARMIGSRGSSI